MIHEKRTPLWKKLYFTHMIVIIIVFLTLNIMVTESPEYKQLHSKYFTRHIFQAYLLLWCAVTIASGVIWWLYAMIKDIWTGDLF